MALTKVGVCTGGGEGNTVNQNNCVLTLPAGCQAGDVLFFCATETSGVNTISGPAATVIRGPVYVASSIAAYFDYYVLQAADITAGSVTVQWSGAGRASAAGVVYRNVDTASIIIDAAATQISTNVATGAVPSITTGAANMMVLVLGCLRTPSTTAATVSTAQSGFTKTAEAKTANSASVNTTSTVHELNTPGAAGSYGGGTMGFAPNISHGVISTVAFAEAAAPSGNTRYIYNGSVWVPQTSQIMT